MIDEPVRLKEMLSIMEELKIGIMEKLNAEGENKGKAVRPTTVYPLAEVKPMMINNYPVFQFSYEGLLPHFNESDKKYLRMIRQYYHRATLDSYNYDNLDVTIKRAVVLFVQYFNSYIPRDLENRNKKFIQDAIKYTKIINDDTWHSVWNMDIGLLDEEKNHVQVYVLPQRNFSDFYNYLMDHHEKLKERGTYLIKKEEAFHEYEQMLLKTERKKREKERAEELEKKKRMAKEIAQDEGLFF